LRRNQTENERQASQSSISFNNDLNDLYWDSWDMQKVNNESIPSSCPSPHINRVRAARCSVPSEEYITNCRQGNLGHNSHSCSTTPCTPVTTMAPSSLNSSAFSPGSQPNIYSPSNSSVFSPSFTSPAGSCDPRQTPPSTPPVKGYLEIFLNKVRVLNKSIFIFSQKTFRSFISNWRINGELTT
jgi:hypothetical protein